MNNLIKDLQDEKYWDLAIKGSFRVLQLRQEWDRDTCIKLRNQIINALKLQELVKGKIKECKQNAGGMVYGMELESLVEESKS